MRVLQIHSFARMRLDRGVQGVLSEAIRVSQRRSFGRGREGVARATYTDNMANSSRMSSFQRREQLIRVGRALFAAKGFEAVSVEEIAASAKVSKPIVYEHFGGKEGLYAVVVDREMRALTDALVAALSDEHAHPRQIVERATLALLTYIEENSEGFQVLARDSPLTDPDGSFSSLLGDISMRVEKILTGWFKRQHLPAKGVPYYAQMVVGMTVYTGQYWADRRKLSKEQLAALIVNLAWHGLSHLEAKPQLRFEGSHAERQTSRLDQTVGSRPVGGGSGGMAVDFVAGVAGIGDAAGVEADSDINVDIAGDVDGMSGNSDGERGV